jgi:N-acetylmuramoyl-L-alanine amidase
MTRRPLSTFLAVTLVATVSVIGGNASAGEHPDRAPYHGARSAATPPPTVVSAQVIVGAAADPVTGGYWLVAADGGIFSFGVPFFGSAGAVPLIAPIVSMAATSDAQGYWLAASDGGVFAFGDAKFSGSAGGTPLTRPVIGMASDPVTGGYWLVAADGGIFSFGAPFFGSTGGVSLAAPIVGMAATADGGGYWLVASDGGVFAFGDAKFSGSASALALSHPIVAMSADPATGGYWLVAADGGVFSFDAPFFGSAGGLVLNRALAAMAPTSSGGYWLVGADGAVYTYGDAPYLGSVSVLPLAGLTVTIDPGHDGGNGSNPQIINQPIDGGGFTEPCDTAGATTDDGYPEHAFNFDVATRAAALLRAEGANVLLTRSTDGGVGPCVNVRAAIGNNAHAAAAISIHADGGPPTGRGFTVITPAPVVSSISNNTGIVAPSQELGAEVVGAFATDTGEPASNYDGQAGLDTRDNLGGLNLSTVPKVLIECANMRNAADAALIENPTWRQQAAQGISGGITAFLVAQEKV